MSTTTHEEQAIMCEYCGTRPAKARRPNKHTKAPINLCYSCNNGFDTAKLSDRAIVERLTKHSED